MNNKELQKQIDALKKRIEELERRPIYVPCVPSYPQIPPSQYPIYPNYPAVS